MIISETQIYSLMNVARALINHTCFIQTPFGEKVVKLIAEIESQQSDKLVEVKDE